MKVCGPCLFFLLTMVYAERICPQNLENLRQAPKLKISGGLNVFSTISNSNTVFTQRPPFVWGLSAQLNLSIWGLSLPFQLNFSNNHLDYSQPFSIRSLSPSYKWVKLSVGQTSVHFSPYTLSGHPFKGAYLELRPGLFRMLLMYGQLKKAMLAFADNISAEQLSFERRGIGALLSWSKSKGSVEFSIFSASDVIPRLSEIPIGSEIRPLANTAFALAFKLQLTIKMRIQAESGFTGPMWNLFQSESNQHLVLNTFHLGRVPLRTHELKKAFNLLYAYAYRWGQIGLTYERVDPDYQTLGSYYTNNDLQKICFNPILNLLQSKLRITLQTGLQQNNLQNTKMRQTSRWANSIQASLQGKGKLHITAFYSNFTTSLQIRNASLPILNSSGDSIYSRQVNQQMSLNAKILLGRVNTKNNALTFLINRQSGFVQNYQMNQLTNRTWELPGFTGQLMYSAVQRKIKSTANAQIQYQQVKTPNLSEHRLLPGFGWNQNLYRQKIQFNYSFSGMLRLQQEIRKWKGENHQLSLSYSPASAALKLIRMRLWLTFTAFRTLPANSLEKTVYAWFSTFGMSTQF